jgi:hypothetical protein
LERDDLKKSFEVEQIQVWIVVYKLETKKHVVENQTKDIKFKIRELKQLSKRNIL